MILRYLVPALFVLVGLAVMVAPILIDARHWWPRKRITLKTRQAFRAATFLVCIFLALRITSGLDGTEFSGGWLSGPLLSMTDVGIGLLVLALVWTFFSQRVAAVLGLVSTLFCLPLYCFFVAPVPVARVFARGHGFKFQPTPGFHWHTWPVAGLIGIGVVGYTCMRDLTGRTPTQAGSAVHPAN